MTDWKKVAKRLFRERREYEACWDRADRENWDIAYAVAKRAGAPLFSECHVSCVDMLRLGLGSLDVEAPESAKRHFYGAGRTEASIRLEQLASCIRRGDALETPARWGWSPLRKALLKRLLRGTW